MPKRSIYLPSDNLYKRTRDDLEFLCNYWDRLLASNRGYDIRLPELLRANHLMRHLSSDQGLRVNVSFTILDDGNYLEPENTQICNLPPYYTESRNEFRRSPYNNNAARHNLLRNYIRQINENYSAIERELTRARVLASLVERNRFAACQNAFYNETQRAAACNWNKFPVGNQACSARASSGLQNRHVNPRERNNRQACTLFGHECCMADRKNNDAREERKEQDYSTYHQQSFGQKENSLETQNDSRMSVPRQHCSKYFLQTSISCEAVKNQPNNNTLQNCTGYAPARNDNGTIKRRSSKETMEACQGVSKIISDAAKISHPAESRPVKLDDDGIAINNSDKRSTEPRPGPVGCQGNGPQRSAESNIVDQSEYVDAKRGCGSKYKFDDLKDREMAVELEPGISSQQDQSNATTERIKPRVKDTSTNIDEKIARSRIRNGRVPIEERSFSRRHVSSPKYVSYLRTSRKEERDDRLRGNSSSRRNDGIEKSQRRKKLFMESSSIERDGRRNPRIGRRTPMPRSTVHTTYNPITRSSTTPILDSSGLTIQFLRLAVLLYAPTLMPALNSLIAQQNQQTPVSMSSAFERSNDLLTQIFRLLNEQQSIPNLPFVSIESERASSALTAETDVGNSRSLSEKKEENTSIAMDKSDSISEQGSSSFGTPSQWKPNDRVQQQNGKNRKWRLTSMLTDSGIRLDKTIFTAEDFRKFEDFLKAKRKRPEDVRSLSMRSKNEVVMKEYFRNWLHRLLQQLNSASSILFKNNEERKFSKIPDKSPLEEVKGQQNRDRLIFDESPNSSKDDGNTLSEREEEDSDDQKSFSSATSTNSSRSLRLKQNDVAEEKESQKNENSQNFDD